MAPYTAAWLHILYSYALLAPMYCMVYCSSATIQKLEQTALLKHGTYYRLQYGHTRRCGDVALSAGFAAPGGAPCKPEKKGEISQCWGAEQEEEGRRSRSRGIEEEGGGPEGEVVSVAVAFHHGPQ
jgi:hypothetical protein